MPTGPRILCGRNGCGGKREYKGACDRCGYQPGKTSRKAHDVKRGSADQRGYDHAWRRFRAAWLENNPLCVECLQAGRTTAAEVVDHIIPHRGDRELFWREGNHQSLCHPHHQAKTARGQ